MHVPTMHTLTNQLNVSSLSCSRARSSIRAARRKWCRYVYRKYPYDPHTLIRISQAQARLGHGPPAPRMCV
jgi:hypothetical protein